MSSIVGTTLPVQATDRRADQRFGMMPLEMLWMRSGMVGGAVASAVYFEPPRPVSGQRRDLQITFPGGAVLSSGPFAPGAVVKGYRTLDDVNNSLVADTREGPAVVVAADGSFIVSVPNADQHYLVGYLTGPPDSTGATVNTLVGT